ncbi:hypothetical protein BJY52DRAFT_1255335 [Lactarius psammicola]|nr:hypothetical protein BJY52DRAFT_1255335 [Lactarius psammicola]
MLKRIIMVGLFSLSSVSHISWHHADGDLWSWAKPRRRTVPFGRSARISTTKRYRRRRLPCLRAMRRPEHGCICLLGFSHVQ